MMSFSLINTERERERGGLTVSRAVGERAGWQSCDLRRKMKSEAEEEFHKGRVKRTNNLHRADSSKFPLPALTCCSVKHGGPTPPDVLVLDVCVRMLRVGLRHHDGVAPDLMSTHFCRLQSIFYSMASTDLSTSSITAPAHGDITGGRGHRCRS